METTRRKTLSGTRFLSFILNGDVYCIRITNVKEIRGMTDITRLPQTPDFIMGVINLRGQIVPVVDLRLRFGMPFLEYHERSTIIVVEIEARGEKDFLGIVVDKIQEVISLPAEQIRQVAYLKAKVKSEYIEGMAEVGDHILIVLDIRKIIDEEDYVQIVRTESPSEQGDAP